MLNNKKILNCISCCSKQIFSLGVLFLFIVFMAGCDTGGGSDSSYEDSGEETALFGFSKDNKRIFTQHVTENGMAYELMTGSWTKDADRMTRFNTEGKQLIMGHSSSGDWWINELLCTGDVGRETNYGKWEHFFETLTGYQVYGKPFIFGLDKNDDHHWFIQRVHSDGTLGGETDSGYFKYYWEHIIPLDFGGPTLLMGHNSDKKWFIQRVHSSGRLGYDTASGDWNNYYDTLIFFKTNRSHFIFGQSKHDNRWFIQRVHSNGTFGYETASGNWNYYYETATAFEHNGRTYLFCQSKKDNRFFIVHVTVDGTLGAEEDSGEWEQFYDFVYPFNFDWSYRDVSDWMGRHYDLLKDRKLKDICIPGSHDAGMYKHQKCDFGVECNTVTQEYSIYNQLVSGARFFDFRPICWHENPDDWYLGHFDIVDGNADGCCGAYLDNALDDIVTFLKDDANAKEVIIIDLSHCFVKTEIGDDYECTSYWTDGSIAKIISSLRDYLVKCDDCDPSDMTLDEILATGGQVIVIAETDNRYNRKDGIFNNDEFYVYNKYSETNDYEIMRNDQEHKLENNNHKYFLLSWTLTLSEWDAANCCFGDAPSVLDLAKIAGPQLIPEMSKFVEGERLTKKIFPNVLFVDNYGSFATRAAIYLNNEYENLPDE